MKLVFATNNRHKLEEVRALVSKHIEIISLSDIECHEDIPETSSTIEGNAIQKVEYIKSQYGYDCFADDTGLEVDALNGAPGVYSARYAGESKNNDANIAKLLNNLLDKNNRNAQFKTVIALSLDDEVKTFIGICKGSIAQTKKGQKGFGYDPVFLPSGLNRTFAEMNELEKNKISHRGKAIQKLLIYLNNYA